jgi:hypothetical protein
MKTNTKRRVHRGKKYLKNKTKKGSGYLKDVFNTITGRSSFQPYKGEPPKTYSNEELVNRYKQRLAKTDDDNFHEKIRSDLESRQAIVDYPQEYDYSKTKYNPAMSAGRRSRRDYKKRSYRKRH